MKLIIDKKLVEYSEEHSRIRIGFAKDKRCKELCILYELLDHKSGTEITKKQINLNCGIKSYKTLNRIIRFLELRGHIVIKNETYFIYDKPVK